ncbi:hypothetical protein D3C80_2219240 [compost metagenome]
MRFIDERIRLFGGTGQRTLELEGKGRSLTKKMDHAFKATTKDFAIRNKVGTASKRTE